MYQDLNKKIVVVTGGASGIGLATSFRFLEEGAAVFILDKNKENMDKLTDSQFAGKYVIDVTKKKEVEQAFSDIAANNRGIDVLIANAGISCRKLFSDASTDQWEQVLDVNLNGVFNCVKSVIPYLVNDSCILMTGSTNGLRAHQYYADYNVSKAGVIMLAKSLALELSPKVRVNAVCPGYVLTPMQQAEYTEEMLAKVNDSIPLKRHAQPEEIANLFAFLASNQSSYITGQAICIDGGETV